MKRANLPVGLGLDGGAPPPGLPKTLRSRCLVPPFSVLDARQGYWQERKRDWMSIGLRGELGRGENLMAYLQEGMNAASFAASGKKLSEYRPENFEAMKGRVLTYNIGENEFSEKVATVGGTSVFDPVLCEIAYLWFCPPGGQVLDPFAGGSVRGVVAAALGRRYTGVELSTPQVVADRDQWLEIAPRLGDGLPRPEWIDGDSRGVVANLGMFDFVFSCPPYADLEVYSDDLRDLSNMAYPEFRHAYREVISASCERLRQDRFAAWVVGDVRGPDGCYRGLVGETVDAFRACGLHLYNEAILVTMVGSLSLRAGPSFSKTRKIGRAHQNLLVFVKGDPRAAADACESM